MRYQSAFEQSSGRGLNPRPRPYQGRALPLSYQSALLSVPFTKRETGLEPATLSLEG